MWNSSALLCAFFASTCVAAVLRQDAKDVNTTTPCWPIKLQPVRRMNSEVEMRAGGRRWKGVLLTPRIVLTDAAPPDNTPSFYDQLSSTTLKNKTRKIRTVCELHGQKQSVFIVSFGKVECDNWQLECSGRCKCTLTLMETLHRNKRSFESYKVGGKSKGKGTKRPRSRASSVAQSERRVQTTMSTPALAGSTIVVASTGKVAVALEENAANNNSTRLMTSSSSPPRAPKMLKKRTFKFSRCACKHSKSLNILG